MSDAERLRRKDPPRTEPLRSWSNLYRDAEPSPLPDPPPAESDPQAPAGESWSEIVNQGVQLGYRVIEEQIRQGQRVAEEISASSYGPANVNGDVREATERMVRYSADLLALWFDFANSTMANGDLLRTFAASWQGARGPAAPAPAGPAGQGTAMSVDIGSARPLRVTLDLKSPPAGRVLATHGLRAPEIDKPPLTDVTFEPGNDGIPVVLHIRVPPTQPPGLYTGVVIDGQSGELLGTLSAQVSE